METKVIKPFYLEHPLILTENVSNQKPINCYGCSEVVTNLEAAYICKEKNCGDQPILLLHRECGELHNQIFHPKHSDEHPLLLFDYHNQRIDYWCDICLCDLRDLLGYRFSTCRFDVDLSCKKLIEMEKQLSHPSHPDHPLTLMRKPAFSFCCDGCGDQDVDMAYICSTCEFWIHKTCASLPLSLPNCHHHHDLSLAFSFPMKDHKYNIHTCDVCGKILNKTCWVYFCGDCRFYAHLKCAIQNTERISNTGEDDNNSSNLIEFPLHAQDISMELITPFVTRENKIPDLRDMPATIKMPETTAPYSFLFNYHKHHLTLVSESHEDHDKIIDDEDDTTNVELKICDLYVMPISSPPYYECVACKYFVHSICYSLPKTISSSFPLDLSHLYGHYLHDHCPKIQNKKHTLTLYTSSESNDMSIHLYRCTYCSLITNGVMYECEGCKMKIDVKCASLPITITRASHPHHRLLVVTKIAPQNPGKRRNFHCCDDELDSVSYCCSSDDCDFAFHVWCVMLPSSVKELEWDKHPLLLTFDASLDHRSDFICGFCEDEMHPKMWMYHCRQCDNSFHCSCLRAASSDYRNIKFGRRFVLDRIHHHPLTFNCITIKKRCDICRNAEYNYCGLECALCNYLVCIRCARRKLASPSLSHQ